MKYKRSLTALVVLLLAAMACGSFGGGGDSAGVGSSSVDTEFPLPKKYENLMETGTGDSGINFQTPMSIDELMEFYREEFGTKLGYTERDYLTNIEGETFQLVFDGHPGGVPIVIQGVSLGDKTNVNIRFEDA